MLTQKEKIDLKLIKINQNWKDYISIPQELRLEKKIKVETENVRKLLTTIPTSNIIELNEEI